MEPPFTPTVALGDHTTHSSKGEYNVRTSTLQLCEHQSVDGTPAKEY